MSYFPEVTGHVIVLVSLNTLVVGGWEIFLVSEEEWGALLSLAAGWSGLNPHHHPYLEH